MSPFRQRLAACNLAWQDGFLSPRDCALLLDELQFSFWRPSTVVTRYGESLLRQRTNTRLSETTTETWFSATLLRAMRRIERRLCRLLGRPPENFEEWQATRYATGGRFDDHNDAGHWREDAAGEREMTVLLYLQTPEKGGGTRFRDLGEEIEARAGRLLVWTNLLEDGRVNPRMIHAGVPVRKGKKCVLVTWIRERAIRKVNVAQN
jgi:prolyl 4-hydroxylase